MTTIVCVSPKTTILIVSVLPLAYFPVYAIMEKRHYCQVQEDYSCNEPVNYGDHRLSCKEKLSLMKQNSRSVATYALGILFAFLTLSSVVTTLAFHNSPFNPRDHYVYYVLSFTTGEFIGRSYIGLFLACNSRFSPVVKQTWILTMILFVIGVLLGFAAWYRFFPSVLVVLALTFAGGVCTGMLYINTMLAAVEDQDVQSKVFSRGFSLIGLGFGSFMAAIFGLIIEPVLREHCLEVSISRDFCFTRSMSEWNSTASCLTH